MMMAYDDPATRAVRRMEVFTGAGQRREWPADVKAQIVAESYSGRESVSAVARRYSLDPSQLFLWRQRHRKAVEQSCGPVSAELAFVPALVEAMPDPSEPPADQIRPQSGASAIELEIDGITVKIGRGADRDVITAVIAALKATR